MTRIYILHENDQWVAPLRDELARLRAPFREWFLHEGSLDLSQSPPAGIFYNRMSASSHTRGHRYAPEYTASVLEWLESHGRRVINQRRALALEVSKVAQYTALRALGIRTPHTIAAVGREAILNAAREFSAAFITKHNRAGKGLGVRLFLDSRELARHLDTRELEQSVDGITLLQEFIEAPAPFITRCEFVGGEFLYAVRVDTSQGFELCPADACEADYGYCPAGEQAHAKFRIDKTFREPIIDDYRRFLAVNDIQIAGIEFIVDREGKKYTYDVNTNTNYNPQAELQADVSGMRAIANYLSDELSRADATEVFAATG